MVPCREKNDYKSFLAVRHPAFSFDAGFGSVFGIRSYPKPKWIRASTDSACRKTEKRHNE